MTTNEVGILPDLTNEGISSASHIFVAQSPNFLRKLNFSTLKTSQVLLSLYSQVMSVYYDLGGHVTAIVASVSNGDEYASSARARAMKDAVKRMDDKQPYSPFHLSLVFASLFKLSIETLEEVNILLEVTLRIKDIFGDSHIVLGDLYYHLADLLGRKRHFAHALELSGQALLIRVNKYGIVHEKTAESHFALGMLYRHLGLFEKSRQELFICRGIRSKLQGDSSTAVAHCDLYIGHTELALSNSLVGAVSPEVSSGMGAQRMQKARSSAIAAYVSFYRSFQCRYIELGPTDPATVEAQELVMRHSVVGGERLVSAMELKLRIQELQWSCSSTNNWLYSVALFVGRLGADEALTLVQLRQLVTSAIRFSVSRLGAVPVASSSSRNSSPAKDRFGSFSPNSSFRNPSRAHLEVSPLGGDNDLDDFSSEPLSGVDPEQEQINVITSMLMMIPKPFVSTGHTPGKRSAPSSPTKASHATAEQKEPPKLRIPGQSSSSTSNSNNNSALNSPAAGNHPSTYLQRLSIKRETSSGDAQDESKASVSIETLEDALGAVNIALCSEEVIPVQRLVESPTKFQSKLKALEAEQDANAVLARSLPVNWKPIRSAYHSLAWSATQVIQKVDFALGSAERIYARDSEGVLLVLRRAAGDTIDEAEAHEKKMLRKSMRKSITAESKRKSIASAKDVIVAGATGGGDDPKAKLNALFGKRAPPGTAEAAKSSEDAGDPRAKLNALFSKQPGGGGGLGLKLGGPPSAVGVSGAAKNGAGPVWDKDIPFPPPTPTSWPPEPYTSESAAAGGDAGAADGAGNENGAMTVSTIVNADGTVVTISTPVPAGPPKPKLKQIYLVSLPSVEGTLWADEEEALISPEELFDDLEAEFTLEKPKVKKMNEVPFGAPGGGAGGLKSTGLMSGGKKGADEAVLDAQRAQNINIMLAKFGKKSYFDLAQSIKWFEAEVVGAAAVASLAAFVPTPDECAKVTSFVQKKHAQQLHQLEEQKRKEKELFEKGAQGGGEEGGNAADGAAEDTAKSKVAVKGSKLPVVPASAIDERALTKLKLGKAEQFVFVFAQVPKLETRLSAMASVLSVKETSSNILSSAETILTAVTEVRGSGRLKFLLKAFLDLNNALCKAAKGQEKATGIKLESLAKLTQTKSNSGETVEQYVVNKVLQHFPDALKVVSDMPSIEAAKAVLFPRLVADLRKLEEGISMMKSLIELDNAERAKKENTKGSGEKEESVSKTSEVAGNSPKTDTADSATSDLTTTSVPPPPPPPPPPMSSESTVPSEEDKCQIYKYLERSEAVFAKATKQLTEAQRDFAELCTYFGEEAPGDPDKLFGQIISFVRGIQAATSVAEAKQKKKDKPALSPMGRPQIKLPNMIH